MGAILGQAHSLRHAKVRIHRQRLGAWWWLMLLACAMPAFAQIQPDAGSIQRDIERQQPMRPPAIVQPPKAAPSPTPRQGELEFQVKSFVLTGTTLVDERDVQVVLQPWLNRPITFSDLEQAKQAIADLYQQRGWFARPQIPEQELQDHGDLRVEVIEGRLGMVRLTPPSDESAVEKRIDRDRIQRTFSARQQTGDYLYMPNVERAVSLLNDTPGLGVNSTLASGETPGATDLVVTPQVRDLWSGTVSADNSGARSTGTDKVTVSMSWDNPIGWGDQTAASLMKSQGVEYGRAAYSLPLGYDGWRLGMNATAMNYHVIYPMSASNPSYPRGSAFTQGLSLSWPALRSAMRNVNFSATLDQKRFLNDIYNPDTGNINVLSNKRLVTGGLSLSGDVSDAWLAGGMTQWNLGWNSGRLDLSGNAQNQQSDQAGIQTQGWYHKFNAGLSRLQRITQDNSVWLSLQGQRSNKNLDSSEKFTLGGAQGIRAYPSAEGVGDHGWQLTLESRNSLSGQWQWMAFYDHGLIKLNHMAYAGASSVVHATLKGVGSGLTYTLPGMGVLRMTWSRRLGDNPLADVKTGMDSDGTYVRNRVWLNLTTFF